LTDPLYASSGGFIPTNNYTDAAGFIVTCNCRRTSRTCPSNCCGQGSCDFSTGTCTCTNPGPNVNTQDCCNTTGCVGGACAPCFNSGLYCSGNGVCDPVTGVCNCVTYSDNTPMYSGAACDVPIPKLVECSGLTGVVDCQDCNAKASAFGIFCTWCTTEPLNSNLSITVGTCSRDVDCRANLNPSCQILVQYVPEPCPDECSGHGTCQNQTDTATNRTVGVCICDATYIGVNCGDMEEVIDVPLAAGLGAAAIVGIVIAIVVVLAALGGGGYAIANNMAAAPVAPLTNNPLYVGLQTAGDNPLNKVNR